MRSKGGTQQAGAEEPLPFTPTSRFEEKCLRLLQGRRLPFGLAAIAVLLASPSLFIGFYLDDFVARYIYSNLPGAHTLYRMYLGGYAIADGIPAHIHWQIEHGFAPWYTYKHLLLAMFRPVSEVTHLLDFHLWPQSAFMMHAHSLLWLALLVIVTTRMYRSALGPIVGGLAALLFAVDYTHGFTVGYISNRHALIGATIGILCLHQHMRWRLHGDKRAAVLAPTFYLVALLASESTIAIAGYLFAFALFAEERPLVKRALTFAPYFVITAVWRAAYNAAGFGAHGSGLYIDPVREPLQYLQAAAVRGPVLLMGQFFAPPAELFMFVDHAAKTAWWVVAVLLVIGLVAVLFPLLRRNRIARFWAAGVVFALVPAMTTYPHNRQLLMATFGGMALLAQLWELHVVELRDVKLSRPMAVSGIAAGLILWGHLIVGPLATPVTTCSLMGFDSMQRAVDHIGDDIGGKDAVFVTSPDYFPYKLVQLSRRVEHKPLARRWRAISFGPVRVVVHRTGDRTLRVDYEGGILQNPFTELYRDRRIPMHPGDRVQLEGLSIEVLAVTRDGRARTAQFTFDRSLDSPSFIFYDWVNDHYERFKPPPVGGQRTLPPAHMKLGL